MENDLWLPLFWTALFSFLLFLAVRRITKKTPTKKRWVRPEKQTDSDKDK